MHWRGYPLPTYAERLPATQIAAPRRWPETPTTAKHMLPSRNRFLDSTEALTTSKQDARTTLWVEEWNALIGDRSTEWRDRGIIPKEYLASGTDDPWSTWRSLNRLRVQKGHCRAMMKMWKLSHTDVCDYGERHTICLILWHVLMPPIAPGQTCLCQPLSVSTVPNTGRNLSNSIYRGLDEEVVCHNRFLSLLLVQ